jgi:ribosomal protein S18 acetylase RimI-like enzyme
MLERTTTYYLEMLDKTEFKPKAGFKEILEIRPISKDIFQQWMLFIGVGLPWRWYSRLSWSPTEWKNYLENNDVRTNLAFHNNKLVGYFELLFHQKTEVEITFLGLFPGFIGEGLGGCLLSHALDISWNSGADKVWLHTCTTDHQFALSNYIARGMKIAKEFELDEPMPEKQEYMDYVNHFLSGYIDMNNQFWGNNRFESD